MSELHLHLSFEAAKAPYPADACLSLNQDKGVVHLSQDTETQVRRIRQAGRKIKGLGIQSVQLQGDWSFEQQWALAQSFSDYRARPSIGWVDNDDKPRLKAHYDAMIFTRDLINRSPEDIAPETLAKDVIAWLNGLAPGSISSQVIVGEELKEAGWMGVYHVGRGSNRPPVMAIIDFNPTGDKNAPVDAVLVGKGITFDSGGYSIKSSEGMLHMKCDMGGAATVTGALGLAITQGLSKRVHLILCCAENLISGHAYKLGDIITYKNGTTVEVVNTDAEGRLVLADGLLAASETKAPLIIDAATLTGAAVMAVGQEYNALFSLDEALANRALETANANNEPTWRLPLAKWHQDQCPSAYADTANSRPQKGGGAGGASNAAGFLSRFVPATGWAHFDLAAAYNDRANDQWPAGGTAQGIRTIAALLDQ